MAIETEESHTDWPAARLGRLDPRSTARLTLSSWPGSAGFGCSLLEQAGKPVGVIKRVEGATSFRTASEEWLMEVCRPGGRLGWQLEFRRTGGRDPTVCYYPRTLRGGGRLVVSGERCYTLHRPVLRADWWVTTSRGRELGRIAFRGGPSPEDLRTYLAFGPPATDEPLLLVVVLAASVAILVHNEEVRAPAYHG